ncbi:hypothetical protein Zmor_021799 [Zophobas morio]|uniref:Uncharacterized protein n=1 Tax=Zophobas morio TaxID=2755281 RepID=A0AA38MBG7_9CUCU|nr:hypothetical protein Zmor_021799 [Zophobas morio]
MSAMEAKPNSTDIDPATRLAYHQRNPSYTIRVICCVFFIFLTEICLAHYVYRLINSEIRSDYVAKQDFQQYFLNEIRNENGRQEVSRIIREYEKLGNISNRKRRSATGNLNYNLLSSPGDEPHVEFFNPELRGALEAKDELIRQQTGNKGAAPGGDSWIWLSSYSRIPVSQKSY